MDINSHIDWRPGMPLKAVTFQGLYRNTEARSRLLLKLFAQGMLMGVLPDTELSVDGVFVRNTFEIERLRLTALLRDGTIIDVDETVQVNIPMLYGDVYYLCVSHTDDSQAFESDDVRYLRPKYAYSLLTLEEMKAGQYMPIAKFLLNNGVFKVDTKYVMPYLLIGSCKVIADRLADIIDKTESMCGHAKLVDADARRTLLQQLFVLKSLTPDTKVHDLISALQELILAIEYFVMRPNEKSVEILRPEILDICPYLDWIGQYVGSATSVLDDVVIEDDSVDYEKLKAEIKAEIYERLNPELYERLINDLKVNLRTELTETLTVALTDYFEMVVEPRIADKVTTDVIQTLHSQLYDTLYDALYTALYIPAEEEEDFTPMI